LIVINTDDFGRMHGDAFTIKNVVLPTSRRPERDFDRALNVLAQVGLIARYEVDGDIYLQVNQFETHQPNLTRRTKSRFPEVPADGMNFMSNLTEQNLIEQNREPRTPVRRRDETARLFAQFWEQYPKKKAKEAAQRAWEKRRPNDELLAVILRALEHQKASPDWQKESGRYIPFPATWLNEARWTDQEEVETTPIKAKSHFVEWLCPHTPRCGNRTTCAIVAQRKTG
jgi:hypothetical protein